MELSTTSLLLATSVLLVTWYPPVNTEEISCKEDPPAVKNGRAVYTELTERITYECDKGFTHTGKRRVNRCRRNGRWTENVECTSLAGCDEPSRLPYSYVDVPDNKTPAGKYPPNSRARHRCLPGYTTSNFQKSYIKCKASPTGYNWTQGELQCREKTCRYLDSPFNGGLDSHVFQFGSRVNFHCNKGYRLRGSRYTICQADQNWSNQPPTCERKCCLPLTPPEKAELKDVHGSCFGDRVTVRCLNDLVMATSEGNKDSVDVECKHDQTWSVPPPCENVTCPSVNMTLGRGRLSESENGKAPLRATITFTCVEDATMDPNTLYRKTATCIHPGKWDKEPPICYKKCPSVVLDHGRVTLLVHGGGDGRRHGTELRLRCDDNISEKYVLENPEEDEVVCRNGTWSTIDEYDIYNTAGAIRCLPAPCDVQALPGTTYKSEGLPYTTNTLLHDSHLTVYCDFGYGGVEDGSDLKCDRGFLKPEEHRSCQLKTCDLKSQEGAYFTQSNWEGSLVVSSMRHGDAAYAWCKRGYIFKEELSHEVTCTDGNLLPQGDYCQPAPCDVQALPGTIYKSEGLPFTANTLLHDSHLTVYCDFGYEGVEDGSDLWCDHGTLKPENRGNCQKKTCDLKSQEGAYFTRSNWDDSFEVSSMRHGDTAYAWCKPGYIFKEDLSHEVTCTDGNLLPQADYCEPANCTIGRLPPHQVYQDYDGGSVNLGEGEAVIRGRQLYLTCEEGYKSNPTGKYEACNGQELTGSSDLTCQSKRCQYSTINHGQLFRDPAGYEIVQSLYHGYSAYIVCEGGYNIAGAQSLKIDCVDGQLEPDQEQCAEGAAWIGNIVTATGGVTTENPNQNRNCSLSQNEGARYYDGRYVSTLLNGHTANVYCDQDYIRLIQSPYTVSCLDGELSVSPPHCRSTVCSLPENEGAHYYVYPDYVTKLTNHHTAYIYCDYDYIRLKTSVYCQDGVLVESPPHCRPRNCQLPQNEGASYYENDNSVSTLLDGRTAAVHCQAGYTRLTDTVSCHEGILSGSPPHCQSINCSVGQLPEGQGYSVGGKQLEEDDQVRYGTQLILTCLYAPERGRWYEVCKGQPLKGYTSLNCPPGEMATTTRMEEVTSQPPQSDTGSPSTAVPLRSRPTEATSQGTSCTPGNATEYYFTQTDDVTDGVKIRFKCRAGFLHQDGGRYYNDGYTTCKEGNWEPQPTCEPACSMNRLRGDSEAMGGALGNRDLAHSKEACKSQCLEEDSCYGILVETRRSGFETYIDCQMYDGESRERVTPGKNEELYKKTCN